MVVAVELDFEEVLWWPLSESLLAPSLVILQSIQMASYSVDVARKGEVRNRDDPFLLSPNRSVESDWRLRRHRS